MFLSEYIKTFNLLQISTSTMKEKSRTSAIAELAFADFYAF